MKLRTILMSTLALAALSACNGKAADNYAAATNIAATKETALPACAPGGATLAITGLCQEQAAALLLASPGPQPAASDGCTWVIEEAKVMEGALLYRAARCEQGTAKLEFVPGTPMGSFVLAVSPYGPQPQRDILARMMGGEDPKATILAEVRSKVENAAERGRCQLRPAAMEGWPSDALVVDEVPIPPADGIRSACGELGFDGGAQTFWRASQGVAWFFELGQETPDIDPGSFTIVHRGGGGKWVRS